MMHQHIGTRAGLQKAFTLIELLVVVSIIVILLAILMPALDKALYQGELAACSGNLNAIAKGTAQYAMNNNRMWPYRTAINGRPAIGGSLTQDNNLEPWLQNDATYKLRRVQTLKEDGNDDRLMLKEYMPLDAFIDPLCGEGEIEVNDPRPDDPQYVYSDYAILFGMSYSYTWRNSWQRKMGKKMNAGGHTFKGLVADFSETRFSDLSTSGSHPDKDGKASLVVRDDNDYRDAKWNTPANTIEPGSGTVSSYKGYIDFNEAYWDGSVRRFVDMRWDEWKWKPADVYPHLFTSLPTQADGNWSRGEFQIQNEDGDNHSEDADPHGPVELNP